MIRGSKQCKDTEANHHETNSARNRTECPRIPACRRRLWTHICSTRRGRLNAPQLQAQLSRLSDRTPQLQALFSHGTTPSPTCKRRAESRGPQESPRNPEDSQKHNPDRLIFSPLPSQDAARLRTCVWHPPTQQQPEETQRKLLFVSAKPPRQEKNPRPTADIASLPPQRTAFVGRSPSAQLEARNPNSHQTKSSHDTGSPFPTHQQEKNGLSLVSQTEPPATGPPSTPARMEETTKAHTQELTTTAPDGSDDTPTSSPASKLKAIQTSNL